MRLLPTPAGLNNRVGQDHVCIYTVYLRCSLQGIHQIYNHTACIYSSGQPYVLIRGRGGCGAQYSATTHPPCLLICTHVFICCFCLHSQGTGGDEEDVESSSYPYVCFLLLLTFTVYGRGRGRCGEHHLPISLFLAYIHRVQERTRKMWRAAVPLSSKLRRASSLCSSTPAPSKTCCL